MTTDFETLRAIVTDEVLERELNRAKALRVQIQRLQDELDQNEALAEATANEILKDDADVAFQYVVDKKYRC